LRVRGLGCLRSKATLLANRNISNRERGQMKLSDNADHFSKLTSCNRRTVLRGIAGSIAPPALISSTDAFANAARGVSLAAAESDSTQHKLTHRTVSVNGLRFHIAESGQGPLVLLCHGFPECWYSWRHQLHALAEAGFHAVAPDMRGFGQTEAPDDIAEYTLGHNIADMVQLVSMLGEQQAVIIGHDWGATVAWNSALLRPDIFRAVVAMSVPYRARQPVAPLKALRDAGTTNFYWLYFQTPGVAEAEFERDVDRTVRTLLYGTGVSLMMKPGKGFLADATIPQQLPSWLLHRNL